MSDCSAIDDLSEDEARDALRRCCGSSRWVERMLAERPFRERERLFEAAARNWSDLGPADWNEAFSHHPRIGDPSSIPAAAASTATWAEGEQAGAAQASDDVKAAIAQGNAEYEARFGRIYIVCATDKSGEELLTILRERLANDPAKELRIVAAEQAKITRLRLEKLLAP
jgi:2-oxo-4-hydroxy-4-carboxy-5-ureidoimidazoline decarboxylase